jgi:hypothetical protein
MLKSIQDAIILGTKITILTTSAIGIITYLTKPNDNTLMCLESVQSEFIFKDYIFFKVAIIKQIEPANCSWCRYFSVDIETEPVNCYNNVSVDTESKQEIIYFGIINNWFLWE